MPLDDIIFDNFEFEVTEPGGVSTEGTNLDNPKSYVDIIFTAVPSRYSSLAIKFRENTMFPFTIYEQFQYLRYATGGQTNPTIYHAVKEGATKEQEAYNYYMALVGGGHVNDQGDLAKEGIKDLFTVSYVAGSNKVTITAVNDCVKFEDWFTNPDITVNIFNQDCSEPLPSLTGTMTLSNANVPCTHVKVSMLTSRLLTDIKTPVAVYPNADNPFEFDVLRGQLINFSGAETQNGPLFSKQFYAPAILDVNDFIITITNKSNSATVAVTNSIVQSPTYPLAFQYRIDAGQWTTQNSFDVLLGASYTLYVKDQYGCEISTPFTVTGYQDTSPTIIQKTFCGDLHELNVGKFLNLFGKQHTMKLGFVCNASAKDVKIFKHIQMLLNIEYSVKNINVKTSRGQERFVPGDHMNYRIREGQHSVPLKNPRDYDDLRGNWSYLEIEIESINNSKVDLFSVMMYLRKSTI